MPDKGDYFLATTYVVRGKVMFAEVSVRLSIGVRVHPDHVLSKLVLSGEGGYPNQVTLPTPPSS